ncbi:hypothetical protein CP061683_0552A, partial [Chlamydia psittaci 06-1683]
MGALITTTNNFQNYMH